MNHSDSQKEVTHLHWKAARFAVPSKFDHARIRSYLVRAAFFALIISSSNAMSQDISTYYSVQNPEEFELDFKNDLYLKGNQLTARVRESLPHYLNLAYGDDPKQQLDVYLPKANVEDAPVLVFFHGGGFSEGDRSHYGFIAAPYAEHGIISVIASYRLSTSGFTYPAQVDDAKATLLWVQSNIADYGGSPQLVFVGGHSAGAILAADVGGNLSWLASSKAPTLKVVGIIPVSGQYELSSGDLDNYAPAPELKLEASPIKHINIPAPAAVVAFGTNSGDALEDFRRETSELLASELASHGVDVEVVSLAGQNHIDTVMALGDATSQLCQAVIRMIDKFR